MNKKTETPPISPTGIAINRSLGGDPRPFDEILRDEFEKREKQKEKNKIESSTTTKPTKEIIIVDMDIRPHFTSEELKAFNE